MIDNKIIELSKRVLSSKEILKVEGIIGKINNPEKRMEAFELLIDFIGTTPKRPIYYIAANIDRLPEHGSRDIMRYCGDYIDQLTRFTLEDKKFMGKWFSRNPLGKNIGRLKK